MNKPKNSRLLLVDGLPGTGKSTLSQLLFLHLKLLQYPVRWFYEEECGHPIHPELDEEISLERDLEKWQNLRDMLLETDTCMLLDGSVFQNTVGWLYTYSFGREQIQDYVGLRDEIIRSLNPTLIYMRHPQPEDAMRRLFEERGQEWRDLIMGRLSKAPIGMKISPGFEGVINYYTQLQALTDELYEAWDHPKLSLAAGDWELAQEQLTRYLEVPPFDTVFQLPEGVERFTGYYREQALGYEWELALENGVFYIKDVVKAPLRFAGLDTFYVSGSSIQLCFQELDGEISMTLKGSHKFFEGLGTTWQKVTV